MATITVYYDGVNLQLSDKGHTNANKSEQIHWHPGDKVYSVTDVKVKSNSPVSTAEFWAMPPKENGRNFKGTISSGIVGSWDYNITCNVGTDKNPILVTMDPRIQVR
ncbi:MAG: hypothetical protein U0W24_11395 [Bacteroidales bacterium]